MESDSDSGGEGVGKEVLSPIAATKTKLSTHIFVVRVFVLIWCCFEGYDLIDVGGQLKDGRTISDFKILNDRVCRDSIG